MKSPFPGMDPFIEACGLWEDFHGHLVERIGETLADQVPANYLVRTGERSYLVLADDERKTTHAFKPDVTVTGEGRETALAVAVPAKHTAPYSVRAYVEEEYRETFVEIQEADHPERLVTCIEVLSPTNKKPNTPGWGIYQRKRQGLFMAHTAHLVEIDLLRGGRPMPSVDAWPDSPYRLLVARRQRMPTRQVWDAFFDRAVPQIPIPLLMPDPDVPLDLQPIIDGIYSRWRYNRSIDYTRPLTPPLTADELARLQQYST